jgi:MoxR-like ATPase
MSHTPITNNTNDARAMLMGLSNILYGKQTIIEHALICLLAGGHLLLEDVPGVGKTTFAQGLARLMGVDFKRVQFTNDLLPSDILGFNLLDRNTQAWRFQAGPIFTHILLADEINRGTPKTQSAMLEAMEERQVTLDGTTYPLPQPFSVIATQNPFHQQGTFPLPESQLDRFLMSLSIGYPTAEAEQKLLMGHNPRQQLATLTAIWQQTRWQDAQQQVNQIKVSPPLADYVYRILQATRQHPMLNPQGAQSGGLSPRAGLALIQAAKASAWISERDFVLPEDVQRVFNAVARHRLLPATSATATHTQTPQQRDQFLQELLRGVPINHP